jgi:hypothetical protein
VNVENTGIPVNPSDLPTEPDDESYAEFLSMAAAGEWLEFFSICVESGNPDGAAGLRACLRRWVEMRENLGLPAGGRPDDA